MAALAGSPQLSGLTSLALWGNAVTDAGAQALARSPHLGRLRWLGLQDTQVSTAGRRALRARFGKSVCKF